MKRIIQCTFFCFSIFLIDGCRKPEKTEELLLEKLREKKTYAEILSYTHSIGIDTALAAKRGPLALLEEISYGHKPLHIRYTAKVLMPDSARIREAAWALVEGKTKNIEKVLAELEPSIPAYVQLKSHYVRFRDSGRADSAAVVAESLNAYRWMNRQAQGAERMVLVNTRGAYLKGFDAAGNQKLSMRVIVGKKDSPTPNIDTYATNIILYPYWNVPTNIALKEMLPKIKEDAEYLENNGMAVIDMKGDSVDAHSINWSEISEDNFPYRFRQDTGEDNSLGLLKVNIKNPLAIYLHDTNVRTLFVSDQRWRSHGCVRLQYPAQLANFLAGEHMLNDDFVNDTLTNQKPKSTKLKQKVPVFILYLGADINDAGQLVFFKDIYGRKSGVV
ncbi:L,D-transpeptidase family protein [Runella slithyformis]|uniref:ErfK/YbiS/YcfS/YnhG family protein n=1 Tax=Runella slithyformis (strain ATCC 29530 / DSM 19594 / LMG 11500 / NCIMB 11436 / LSU 4) TaxID=761193 RepID=A0A7U3ZFX3_RUNSL|nr:L,D-transpeptidase family protein [Runella slithyformis]AEI46486.1 ErfK/YbiS/YcfS/YnhG family protein [Runella slithyformis DSM 19594]